MPRYVSGVPEPRRANNPAAEAAGLRTSSDPLLVRTGCDTGMLGSPAAADVGSLAVLIEDEDSAGRSPFPVLGTAGISSSIVNIANTILGSGILAMAHAISSVGLIPGFCMVLFSALASGLGLHFLSRCAARTHGRSASFNACAQLTFPNAALWFDLAIAIKCFGVGISYLIIIGDLMPEIVRSLGMFLSGDGWALRAPALLLSRHLWITVSMAGVVPLAYLPTLDAMRYTSSVALMSVAYLWCIVVFHYFDPQTPRPPPEDISYVNMTWSFFNNLPIFVFAFTCHQNIFSVYNELRDNSHRNITKVIVGAICASFFVYETVGCLGYLTFGDSIGVNILSMYNKSMTVAIGRFSFVFLVLFSFPLQCHPCRFSLDKVLYSLTRIMARRYMHIFPTDDGDPDDESQIEGPPSAQAADSTVNGSTGATAVPRHSVNFGRTSTSAPVPADGLADAATHGVARSRQKSRTGVPIPSAGRHAALTTGIVISSYSVAMLVSSLDVVLSFVGSTGSTTISFILPGLFYWKLHKDEPASRCPSKIVALGLAAYGACVMVVCLGFNLGRPGDGAGH